MESEESRRCERKGSELGTRRKGDGGVDPECKEFVRLDSKWEQKGSCKSPKCLV